jgi:hypothetical protein
VSDFRDRFGAQLAMAAAELAAAREGDFRVRLGVQLTAAANELAASRAVAPVGSRARPRRRRRLPWLTRPIAVALALAAAGGTAFAAVAIWTPLLGNQQYGYNPGASTSAPPQDELNALAVLRRPQTDADRGALTQAALTYINDYTTGVRTAYVRLLATVGGVAYVLVPVEQRDSSGASAGAVTTAAVPNALCLYAISSVGPAEIVGGCWSLAEVVSGHAVDVLAGQFVGLAPDGATTATAAFVGAPSQSAPIDQDFFDIPLPSGSIPPPFDPSVTFSVSDS